MGSFKDLTGKVFHYWVVIGLDIDRINKEKQKRGKSQTYWICKCKCGTIKSISGGSLVSGGTKSCGCLRNESLNDLTGKNFGYLTVICRDTEREKIELLKNKAVGRRHNHTYWLCRCVCGNIKSNMSESLLNGRVISCGCQKFKDLTDKTFGNLRVLYRDTERELKVVSHTYWMCKCSCGNLKSVESNGLIRGSAKDCGCSNFVNLEGKTIHMLTVLRRDRERENSIREKKGHSPTYWLCKCECGTITSIKYSHLSTGSIKSCGCVTSFGEKRIKEMLNERHIKYNYNARFDNLRSDKGHQLKYDFVVFNSKNQISHIIEFDGEQHFGYTGRDWSTKKHFEEGRRNDLIKNKYCFDNNIPLIRIPYTRLDKLNIQDLLLESTEFRLTKTTEEGYYKKYTQVIDKSL